MNMKAYLYLTCTYLILSLACSAQVTEEENREHLPIKQKSINAIHLDNYIEKREKSRTKFSKAIQPNDQKELDSIVNLLKVIAPESYEYNYVEVLNQKNDPLSFSNLEKAAAASPNNVELFHSYIIHYELTNNPAKKKKYCQKLFESNIYPQGLLEYSFNLLNSLEKDAILFTYGNYDTYPTLLQQEVNNIRNDVTVLNLDLLENENYRSKKYQALNLKNPKCGIDEIFQKTIINNPSAKIYLSSTVNPNLLSSLSEQLFITGLALKYSQSDYNNIEVLANNWKFKFKTTELSKPTDNLTLNRINLNYTLPLIVLYNFHQSKGNSSEQIKIEELLLKIAKEGNQEDLIKKYIGQ